MLLAVRGEQGRAISPPNKKTGRLAVIMGSGKVDLPRQPPSPITRLLLPSGCFSLCGLGRPWSSVVEPFG